MRRREAAERRAGIRGRWWFPLLVVLVLLSGSWSLLKTDQWIADELVWPTSGAQYVEVGPLPADPAATGGRMVIVAAGLNRKSGTGVAASLMPSLAAGGTRVFSLVYGSGISDRDIIEKYDTLIARYLPGQVSFFGSSMGGDVVLGLAAHTQELREDYRRGLIITPARVRLPAPSPGQRDDRVGAQAATAGGLLGTPDTLIGSVGDVGIAVQEQRVLDAGVSTAAAAATTAPPPPRLGTIYLDCSPLGVDDVRDSSRTGADALTTLMEALDSEGGVAVRMTAEVLAQQQQWSYGKFPFVQVRGNDLRFKVAQVWREKIGTPGISTQLVKDQYGVIRRTDIDAIVDALGPGTRIVYFLPENRRDDRTVRVERVERTLLRLAQEQNLEVQIVTIPDGHHASAESNSEVYRSALDQIAVGGR